VRYLSIIGLSFVVDNQRSYHSRYPAGKGEKKDDQERAASLVDNRQGREENAYEDAPETHGYLRLAKFDLRL